MTIHPRLIQDTPESLFQKLSDLRNLGPLMPDSVKGFQATETDCSFQLGPLGTIHLERTSMTPHSEIVLQTKEQKPFAIALHIQFTPQEGGTLVGMSVKEDLNPFMRMMVEKPLEQFLGLLLKSLSSAS